MEAKYRNKFKIQDDKYKFPFHYLVSMNNGLPSINKYINWGWEYLTYITYIKNYIEKELLIDSILDIGCGDGYLLNNLDGNIKLKCGIDLSKKAIKFAKAFSSDAVFDLKNVEKVTQKFSLITLIEVLEHIPDELVEYFLNKSISLIKKDGYFIISVPTDVLPVRGKHFRHYNEELLNKHVHSGYNLKIVKQVRLYKKSKKLNFIKNLLNNNLFSINYKNFIKKVWDWHLKNTFFADNKNGCHLVTIYKKV